MGGTCLCVSSKFKLAIPASLPPLSIYGHPIMKSLDGPNSMGTIEEQIEHSKSHWSQLSQFELNADKVSNGEVFWALQLHLEWGTLFQYFGEDGVGELVMGPKFVEGGQVELYDVEIQWKDPWMNEQVLQLGYKWALKVFKKGTSFDNCSYNGPVECYRIMWREWKMDIVVIFSKVDRRVRCSMGFCWKMARSPS